MRTLIILAIGLLGLSGAADAQKVLNGSANWTVVSSQFPPDPSTCLITSVGNIYIQAQNPNNGPMQVLYCTQVGPALYQWQPIGYSNVRTLPPKCASGQVAFLVTASAGNNLYGCTSPNTWTLQSGGGGGGGGGSTGLSPTDTWATIEAGGSHVGSITPTMAWAQIEAL